MRRTSYSSKASKSVPAKLPAGSRMVKLAGLLVFILWAYNPHVWTWATVTMTPGWFGVAAFSKRQYCRAARVQLPTVKTLCIGNGTRPKPLSTAKVPQ